MKNFIKSFFGNRLGNTFAIAVFIVITFNQSGICERLGLNSLQFPTFIINIPAWLASAIFFEIFVRHANHLANSNLNHYSLITLFFVYLQWVFIGWMAGTIARKIQPNLI